MMAWFKKTKPEHWMTQRERITVVVAEFGIDIPGGSIHSWRCEYPETYGVCNCTEEFVNALLEVLD